MLLNSYGIAKQVNNEKELSKKLIENFNGPKKIYTSEINLLNNYGEKILKETTAELNKFIQ